jgi:hypothetical protein
MCGSSTVSLSIADSLPWEKQEAGLLRRSGATK